MYPSRKGDLMKKSFAGSEHISQFDQVYVPVSVYACGPSVIISSTHFHIQMCPG